MKILFYDNGLCTELAITMARAGHSVAYTTPWTEAFTKAPKAYIGRGLEGLTTFEDGKPIMFAKALEKCDIVVCPDTFSTDRVLQARAAGKPVWGAGEAEELELDRGYMKGLQHELGLEVGPYKRLIGWHDLIPHLESTKNRWIKSSRYRQIETFKHIDWPTTRDMYLGPLLCAYGPAGDEMEFLSEEALDGDCEVGIDGFFTAGQWLNPIGWGYEAKDEAYIGTAGKIPAPLLHFTKALATPLASMRANSFISNEVIFTKNGTAYQIEPTIRCPHPPTAGMLEMYRALGATIPQLVRNPNQAKMTSLQVNENYCAVLCIRSQWAGDNWLEITIDPKFRQMVKLSQACRIGGKFYACPGNDFVAYAVGLGHTPQAAADMCKKVASKVKCRDMDVNPSALDRILDEQIVNGKKHGITF